MVWNLKPGTPAHLGHLELCFLPTVVGSLTCFSAGKELTCSFLSLFIPTRQLSSFSTHPPLSQTFQLPPKALSCSPCLHSVPSQCLWLRSLLVSHSQCPRQGHLPLGCQEWLFRHAQWITVIPGFSTKRVHLLSYDLAPAHSWADIAHGPPLKSENNQN